MSERQQSLKDDVAFLRAMAGSAGAGAAKEGAMLVAVGVIFGLVALEYWLVDAAVIAAPKALRPWLWIDGLAPFLLVAWLIARRFREPAAGPAGRALSAAWAGVGFAHIFAALALALGGRRLGLPLLAAWVFPVVLFTLIGATWGVAFAVRRRLSFAFAAAGSLAAALLCGAAMGKPEEWLALSGGLVLLVALPGGLILRAGGRRR